MFFLIGVVVAAITWALRPAIFTAAMSVIAFDFFFVPPTLTFRVSDSGRPDHLRRVPVRPGWRSASSSSRARDLAFAAQRRGGIFLNPLCAELGPGKC